MIDATINKNIESIKLKLKTIPEAPGVYQHLDASGCVIYVGKARNLQRRVSSYFSHYEEKSPKIKMLVRKICDIRITVVATEIDALLLENNLIKRYQPRYNSMLKDDKTYPYLCITQEDYPRILFTRNRQHKGHYFGPYPNQRILHELETIIRQLFTYRTCNHRLVRSDKDTVGQKERPCMKYQIGLCKAPCAGLQLYSDYNAEIENIRRILRGDFADITHNLKQTMMQLAKELRFEEADVIKRKLQLLEAYQSRSTVVNTNVKDVDVVSIVSDDKIAYVNMMRIKNGSIIYSFSNEVYKQLDESDAEILAMVLPALHNQTESTAHEVVLPMPVPDLPNDYLKQTIPSGGDRLRLLQLSQRNVEAFRLQNEHRRKLLNPDEVSLSQSQIHTLERIQKILHLHELPIHIECFDNSHIQGAYAVAAMVRFTNGKPNRSAYRKYNIKGGEGSDDYASMAEILHRRYSKLPKAEQPQLIVVDGGKGQMEVAHRIIQKELGLNIPIAGLAKDDRHHTSELLYGFPPQVVGLKPTDALFHLLEQMQNEVHRFAITFHKQKRSKTTFRTQLTDIPGIGEKTARDLLLHFNSVKQLYTQTEEDIAKIIGPAKARQVWQYLHKSNLGEHNTSVV